MVLGATVLAIGEILELVLVERLFSVSRDKASNSCIRMGLWKVFGSGSGLPRWRHGSLCGDGAISRDKPYAPYPA